MVYISSFVCARIAWDNDSPLLEFNGKYFYHSRVKNWGNGIKRYFFGNVDKRYGYRYDFWFDCDKINERVGDLYWIDKANNPLVINSYNLVWAFGRYWDKRFWGK